MSFNSRGHVLAKGLKYTRPSIAVDVLTSSEELITLQRLLGVFIQECLPPYLPCGVIPMRTVQFVTIILGWNYFCFDQWGYYFGMSV